MLTRLRWRYDRRDPWKRPALPIALLLGYVTIERIDGALRFVYEPEDKEVDELVRHWQSELAHSESGSRVNR